MSKVNTGKTVPNWNNIRPVYVKKSENSPFLLPAWIFSLSIALTALVNFALLFIPHASK